MGLLVEGLNRANYLASGSGWDLSSFLDSSKEQVTQWGGAFLMLVGVVGVIWAAFQIISGLMSNGKKQVSYGTQTILLLVSGALATTGISLVMDIAAGGQKTIEDLGSTVNIFRGFDLSTIGLMIQNGLLF